MPTEALRKRFLQKTVRLKTGGPLMTVDAVIETQSGPMLECCWFDLQWRTKIERAPFTVDSVLLAGGQGPQAFTV
ncbi:hypothetical protein BC1002_6539 [Paraburkholderia atlantica]|uniref:DUF2158 domain-containing protein n=1 Tax=Paraburkholderia atlantica TaxID=2654982 RepID=D5WMD4_PARAM|nr:DUF2158 domain-containing protein [Paraburkholderia atlantica]ADG20380.1 hypothetical protein BC1002_6539 [Paraburkholderia atlantica]